MYLNFSKFKLTFIYLSAYILIIEWTMVTIKDRGTEQCTYLIYCAPIIQIGDFVFYRDIGKSVTTLSVSLNYRSLNFLNEFTNILLFLQNNVLRVKTLNKKTSPCLFVFPYLTLTHNAGFLKWNNSSSIFGTLHYHFRDIKMKT